MAKTQTVHVGSEMLPVMKRFMLNQWAHLDNPDLDGESNPYVFELTPITWEYDENGDRTETTLDDDETLNFLFNPIKEDSTKMTLNKNLEDQDANNDVEDGVVGPGLYFEIARGKYYEMYGLTVAYSSSDDGLSSRQLDFIFYSDEDKTTEESVVFTYGGDLIVTDIEIIIEGDD